MTQLFVARSERFFFRAERLCGSGQAIHGGGTRTNVQTDRRCRAATQVGNKLSASPEANANGYSRPGRGPCSASNLRLTSAKLSIARSSVARSWVAITLVRNSAPDGGTAGWSATFTKIPAS